MKNKKLLYSCLILIGLSGCDSSSTSLVSEENLVDTPQISIASKGDPLFKTEHFSGSQNCERCHNRLSDDEGKDVSIIKDWQATMMANATRDPFWKAKVRTELNRTPQLAEVINDKCSKCHAPMAHFEASKVNAPIEILDSGFTNPNNIYHDAAMEGVSCTLCHQIEDSEILGTPEGMSGHYPISNPSDRKLYGPYENVFTQPMQMNVNYTPTFSAHVKESELCATCHNLKTPFADEQGNILSSTPESEFPEQMPYSEWEASDFADTTSCQECHMLRSDGVKISTRPNWLEARDNFAQHAFVGGNSFMLDMLSNNKEELGVIAEDFSKVMRESELILASAATIAHVAQEQNETDLSFGLHIKSETGHKLPSAYPSRRVFLHVVVKNSVGNIVFESGKINTNGSIVGVDSDENQTIFEPHYNVITSEDQVQVYEAIMQDTQENVTYTLLRASGYIKDNRLLPTGFDKSTVSNDIKVKGNAANDDDFIGGSDDVLYKISGLTAGTYSVTAKLMYQTLAYGFAQDLFKDSAKEITAFKRMYDASNAKVSKIVEATFVVSIGN